MDNDTRNTGSNTPDIQVDVKPRQSKGITNSGAQTLQQQLETRQEHWNECVVYIGVGCFVTAVESLDQQLPAFMRQFCSTSLPDDIYAKAILFDPSFRHNAPLLVEHDNLNQRPWHKVSYNLFRQGHLLLAVSNNYFEDTSSFFPAMKKYIKDVIMTSGLVVLGMFTQPYCQVEENISAIRMYNDLVTDEEVVAAGKAHHFQFYHLADYATRTPSKQTLVWYLNGKVHSQDRAVEKEVARYKGEGISFGVGSYGIFPGNKYSLHRTSTSTPTSIDYAFIQEQVEQTEEREGTNNILQENECLIAHLPLHINFVR